MSSSTTRTRHISNSYVEAVDLQLGYAATVHVHQGATVERTVVAARPDELYGELAYVTASRARDDTQLFLLGDVGREHKRAEIGPVSQERARDQRDVLLATMG